jgi:hypothetical protein
VSGLIRVADESEIEIDRDRFSFPPRFKKFRKSQYEAAVVTDDLHKSGVNVVVIEASVGFGKTGYAEIVRQLRAERIKDCKMVYVAPTNGLITQMIESFPYAKELKGRLNYAHGGPTGKADFDSGKKNCGDCVGRNLCGGSCSYLRAKRAFNEAAKIGITNTAFFIRAANYLRQFNPKGSLYRNPKMPEVHGWQGEDHLTVFDEADELEGALLGFFEVSVYPKFLQEVIERAGLRQPNGKNWSVPKAPVSDFSDWFTWWIDVRDLVDKALVRHGEPDPDDIVMNRWVTKLKKLYMGLNMVEPDWIYDPIRGKNEKGFKNGAAEKVILKPKQIGELGKPRFWDHTGDVVCMSGSIGSIEVFAEETGLDKSGKTYEFIRYETKWDKWRRTIHRVPGFKVTKKPAEKWQQQEWWEKFIGEIAWILMKYPDERTLIHSVSHEMAEALGESLGNIFGNRILISKAQKEDKDKTAFELQQEAFGEDLLNFEGEGAESLKRDEALEAYLAEPGKVIISASFIRGTDLYDDRCRNIIFPKIPFEYLGDRRIAARMETPEGRLWYLVQAVRKFTQGAGRGMRHSKDWCRIWVLDEQVDRLIKMRGIMNDYLFESFRPVGDYMSRF